MKILLLEDNENLSEIIVEMLEEKNYKVDTFSDGEEAYNNIINGYDCFVLDINVPNIDGLTILKTIRECQKDVPIIIITSNIELETVKKAYEKGCNDFLKKPFYIYELETKIDQLCKKNNIFNLKEGFYFDINLETLFNKKNKLVKLTHKETLFLIFSLKYANRPLSLEAIEQYVWEGEISSLMSIRQMIKRLRSKLPKNTIETTSCGYILHAID
ncbi:MAG: response regulator transcription factor [Halarcobacter sp.]